MAENFNSVLPEHTYSDSLTNDADESNWDMASQLSGEMMEVSSLASFQTSGGSGEATRCRTTPLPFVLEHEQQQRCLEHLQYGQQQGAVQVMRVLERRR